MRARRRHLLVAVSGTLSFAMVYGIAYWRLRVRHDFVHNATYYTDASTGARVRTDTVSLGERRVGPLWWTASAAFFPARLAEGRYWRGR